MEKIERHPEPRLPHPPPKQAIPAKTGDDTPSRSFGSTHITGVSLVLVGAAMMSFAVLPSATPAAAGVFTGHELRAGDGGGGVLAGMWGGDELYGGDGRDVVVAGSGDDFVEVSGGGQDVVRCGPGDDTVNADAADIIAADCETIFGNRG